jgi:DNA (cytosine-5)-methyltransferase 1
VGSSTGASGCTAVAFETTQITSPANRSNPKPVDPCHPLAAGAHPPAIAGTAVRRLTPRECERLQGFPDDYTLIPITKRQPVRGQPAVVKLAADGPRYKALGNSMAVPVMSWIGERIAMVDAISKESGK